LYDDFARRIRPENWLELLADDVCVALDTRPQAETALLNFLTQDFYIPQSVWQVLSRQDRSEIEQASKRLARLLDEIEFILT